MDNMDPVDRILQIGRDFHNRGWVLGTSGNFSAVLERDPLQVAITASAAHKGALTRALILRVDGNAAPIQPGTESPSAETQVHLAVVRRTGAAAVLHTHSVYSTLISMVSLSSGGIAIEGFEMLKGLAGVRTHEHREWLPVLNNTQDMTSLAGEVDALLRSQPAVHGLLVHRHGLYTWGADLNQAVRHVEILEFLLEVLWRSFEFQKTAAQSAIDVK